MREHDLTDLDYENKARLRAELTIMAGKLRRQIIRTYENAWAESVLAGKPLQLRSDPDTMNALALEASLEAFGGRALSAGDDS